MAKNIYLFYLYSFNIFHVIITILSVISYALTKTSTHLLGYWYSYNKITTGGRNRMLGDKSSRKISVAATVSSKMMFSEPLHSRQIPMPLLANGPITPGCQISVLYQITIATWPMKTHGWKWTKDSSLTLIQFKWLLQEKFNPFLLVMLL